MYKMVQVGVKYYCYQHAYLRLTSARPLAHLHCYISLRLFIVCVSAGCRTDEAEAASASSKARTQRRHARIEAGRCLLGACEGRKDGRERKSEASGIEGCCDFGLYSCTSYVLEITCMYVKLS